MLVVLDGKHLIALAPRTSNIEDTGETTPAIIQIAEYEDSTLAGITRDSEIPLARFGLEGQRKHKGNLKLGIWSQVSGEHPLESEPKQPSTDPHLAACITS